MPSRCKRRSFVHGGSHSLASKSVGSEPTRASRSHTLQLRLRRLASPPPPPPSPASSCRPLCPASRRSCNWRSNFCRSSCHHHSTGHWCRVARPAPQLLHCRQGQPNGPVEGLRPSCRQGLRPSSRVVASSCVVPAIATKGSGPVERKGPAAEFPFILDCNLQSEPKKAFPVSLSVCRSRRGKIAGAHRADPTNAEDISWTGATSHSTSGGGCNGQRNDGVNLTHCHGPIN